MAKQTPETKVKRQIKKFFKTLSICHWANRAGIGSHRGLEDYSVLHQGKYYGIEVKSRKGRQTPLQRERELEVIENGGVYILAKSVGDVINDMGLDKFIRW